VYVCVCVCGVFVYVCVYVFVCGVYMCVCVFPLQPSHSLSTVQYQPAGEGATLFVTPTQSSPP